MRSTMQTERRSATNSVSRTLCVDGAKCFRAPSRFIRAARLWLSRAGERKKTATVTGTAYYGGAALGITRNEARKHRPERD